MRWPYGTPRTLRVRSWWSPLANGVPSCRTLSFILTNGHYIADVSQSEAAEVERKQAPAQELLAKRSSSNWEGLAAAFPDHLQNEERTLASGHLPGLAMDLCGHKPPRR